MKAKRIAVTVLVSMSLTACAANTANNESIASSSVLIPAATAESAAPTVLTTEKTPVESDPIPETTIAPITTNAPVITTEPISETTTATITTNAPVTTTAPIPETTPATEPTDPPTPITTAEPVREEVPDAADIVGRIPASPAVAPSWFDDACFIGDSVSLKLKTYCLGGALGKAQFFTVGSYSTVNALKPATANSTHPSYQGVKMTSEDCVAASGARKVYIMLGMNDLVYGIDTTISRYQTLVERILQKSPDAIIFVQSMTPMASTSNVAGKKLNNDNIKLYNQRLEQMCEDRGWYFVDVASVMYDDSGIYLRNEYCSDRAAMGIHFTAAGCAKWVEYLRTHALNMEQD